MAYKSTFSPWRHHDTANEEPDTATLAAAVTASIEAAAAAAIASIKSATDIGDPQLLVGDTIDHVINAAESTNVEFSVSGLAAGASGTVTFIDDANHQVTASIAGNGTYGVDLSSLTDGVVTSSIASTDSAGHTNSLPGNSVSLDTDKDLHPVLSVNATDPAHVTFNIAGFEGDEKGSITFTDSLGAHVTVNVGSNGNYSTDLSSLASGKVSYLLTETDPAGNTISIDPPVLLGGDGSAGAPGGTPQVPHLLDGYAVRPTWEVAGVDYAVGVHPGITLKVPTSNNLPAGATLGNHTIYINGTDVTLSGYNLTNYTVLVTETAKGTATIVDCAATTNINVRSTVDATANLVVKYCSFDGGGTASDPDFQLIKVWCPLTVEYSVLKNAPAAIYAPEPLTVMYNVMSGFAWVDGAHACAIAVEGTDDPNASALIAYNTIYSGDSRNADGFPIGIGTGIAFYNDAGGNFYNSTVANNTVIANLPGGASYLTGFYVDPPGTATNADVQDNFYASVNGFNNGNSGAYGALYTGAKGTVQATYTNNIDMNTGKLVAGSDAGSGGGGTSVKTPVISGFSDDTGVIGDHVTNDNTLTLSGKAAVNSTVKIYDGAKLIGTVTADGTGAWSFASASLADGAHKFTATATSSGVTSAASTAFSVTVDTVAPIAPTIAMSTPAATLASTHVVQLTGTAEANSTVKVYDGASVVGTAAASSSGAWTFTTPTLANGSHSFTAKAMDAAGNTGAGSAALALTVSPSTPTPPAAPVIASFSPDTGVSNIDGITNASTLHLSGTTVAGSTVTVYDNGKQIGTANADSTGNWDYITSVLTNAKHLLTATDTVSGVTSTASSPLTVTVDTAAPLAPILVSDSVVNTNHVLLSGTAEANSTITVYEGTTVVGIATAGPNGAWSVTTGALASGAHVLTATAMDVAGNVSALSQPLDPVISSAPTPPAAPQISTFSTDSGIAGDHITNDNTLMLTGTAAANSTVNVFDGKTPVGTATANSSGQWHLTTQVLSDGPHNLTATDTDSSGHISASSADFSVTIDTHAPGAPTMAVYSLGGTAVGNTTALNDLVLKGTAEANSKIDVFDSGKQIGTTSTSASGAWSLDTGHLANGSHSFTATAIDVAGNISAASLAKAETVTAPATPTSSIEFTNVAYSLSSHTATIKGTADAYSQVKLYDGTLLLGTVTASGNGTWSLTNSHMSNTLHTIKAQEFDSTGHAVETSSGAVILAASYTSTLKGTGGDDFLFSSSSSLNDTFVFAPNFGHSTIEGFTVSGAGHDTVQFSKSVFDSFASVLAHATQVGHDVVISADASDSVTLKNIKLSALNSHDFHFA